VGTKLLEKRVPRSLAVALVAVLLLSIAGAAIAARPKPSATYAGKGRVCENNAPRHRYTACLSKRVRFSFKTSADASAVVKFRGRIGPFYCGGGSSTVTVKRMTVARSGSFDFRFSAANRGPDGPINGTSHVHVHGRFLTGGKRATVFYRLVTHFNNTPRAQDCGAQVRGTARKQ
jgi:hypothetical protein